MPELQWRTTFTSHTVRIYRKNRYLTCLHITGVLFTRDGFDYFSWRGTKIKPHLIKKHSYTQDGVHETKQPHWCSTIKRHWISRTRWNMADANRMENLWTDFHHIWNIIMALICKCLLTRVAKSNVGREGGYLNCFHYTKKYTLLQFTYMLQDLMSRPVNVFECKQYIYTCVCAWVRSG